MKRVQHHQKQISKTEPRGISQNQLEAIKSAFLHNKKHVQDIGQITSTLTKLNIEHFNYTKYRSKVRMVEPFDLPKYVESYLNEIDTFPREIFSENNIGLVTDKISLYPPAVVKTENNKIIQMETAHGIGHGISFIKNDKMNDVMEVFTFYGSTDNPNFLNIVFHKTAELENFCYSFKEKAARIINEGCGNNKIYLPNVTPFSNYSTKESIQSKQSFKVNKYYLIGLNENAYLTKKEFMCLKLYGKGFSAKEISEELFLSHRTIEKHLENVRKKSIYYDLVELYEINYVK